MELSDYLSRSINLHKSKWRLVNRFVESGSVFLTQDELVTLLQDEIYKLIRSKVDDMIIPPSLLDDEAISASIKEILASAPRPPTPRIQVFSGDYPPCVAKAVEMIQKGDGVHTATIDLTGSYTTDLSLTQNSNSNQTYTLTNNCQTSSGCDITVTQN